jgi:hypothetical protein
MRNHFNYPSIKHSARRTEKIKSNQMTDINFANLISNTTHGTLSADLMQHVYKARVFRDPSGKVLVAELKFSDNFGHLNTFFLSPDGVNFFQTEVISSNSDKCSSKIYLALHGLEEEFKLELMDYYCRLSLRNGPIIAEALILLKENWQTNKVLNSSLFHLLPLIYQFEYYHRLNNDHYVVVLRPTYNWSLNNFRVFFGMKGQMKELQLTDPLPFRLSDGGTTHINTTVGKFYYPSSSGRPSELPLFIPDGSAEFLLMEPLSPTDSTLAELGIELNLKAC